MKSFIAQFFDYHVTEVVTENSDRYIYKLEKDSGETVWVAWIPQSLSAIPIEVSELSGKQQIFTFAPDQSLTAKISGWPSIWE